MDEELSALERLRGGEIPSPKIKDTKRADTAMHILFGAAILTVMAIFIAKVCFHPVIVAGSSMEPTYHDGEILRTDCLVTPTQLERGDVISFRKDGELLLKRIAALPGDTVSFKDGHIVINGIISEDGFALMDFCPEKETVLSDGQYYVLGDNRKNSVDSRMFGPVEFKDIEAVVNSGTEQYKEMYREFTETLDRYEEIKNMKED